jgi:hypothetical protein
MCRNLFQLYAPFFLRPVQFLVKIAKLIRKLRWSEFDLFFVLHALRLERDYNYFLVSQWNASSFWLYHILWRLVTVGVCSGCSRVDIYYVCILSNLQHILDLSWVVFHQLLVKSNQIKFNESIQNTVQTRNEFRPIQEKKLFI